MYKRRINLFEKGHQTMKIKLFTRELVPDGTNGLGFQAFKPEPDKEFETRINDFMIDKKCCKCAKPKG